MNLLELWIHHGLELVMRHWSSSSFFGRWFSWGSGVVVYQGLQGLALKTEQKATSEKWRITVRGAKVPHSLSGSWKSPRFQCRPLGVGVLSTAVPV